MEVIPEQSDLPEIKFKNVSFSYDKKEVLHNINFTLEKNKMLRLIAINTPVLQMLICITTRCHFNSWVFSIHVAYKN